MDREVLDLVPEAVVVLAPDGTVRACNDRAWPVLGVRPDDVGRPLDDVLELRERSGARRGLPIAGPRIGDRLPERTLQLHTAGRVRAVSVAARWSGTAWTLTARPGGRREAQAHRQSDVVATVSHEIRSPLSSIKGFTSTLLGRWDRFSDAQKRAMLETVDADADRVTRLLLDLLEVARIDADRVQLQRAPVDVGALVADVLERVRHRNDAAGRSLTLHVAPELPRCRVDAGRIEQAVTNLVDNALRHAPDAAIEVGLHAEPGWLVLTVRDDGPGIPEELRPSLFEKFGRGRGSRQAGTGLGLYITRGLVLAHGGAIEAIDDGPGATFRVTLPVAD